MKKSERVLGCVYIPIHAALLPLLLGIIFFVFEIELSSPYQMLIYFTVSFVLVLLIMLKFLRASFSDMLDDFWLTVQSLILGFVLYRVLIWVAVILMTQVMTQDNPNSEAIATDLATDLRAMIIVTAVLAPIIEEALFRGAIFGTIRQKSRVAAYIVSVLLFSAFHLWDNLVFSFQWETLILIVQYVPPSIALAWCYERSGTIWAPILLHSMINLTAALQFL